MKNIFLIFLFVGGAMAQAAQSRKDCPFNVIKVESAVQDLFAQKYLPKVPFWNQVSPVTKCFYDRGILCRITFAAKDETPFFIADYKAQDNSAVVYLASFNLATDEEGNYIQPLTCQSRTFPDIEIYNQKTGVSVTSWNRGYDFSYVK